MLNKYPDLNKQDILWIKNRRHGLTITALNIMYEDKGVFFDVPVPFKQQVRNE